MQFVIGVDRRTGRLGADIERHLKARYDIADFEVMPITCSLTIRNVRDIAKQVDCILQALYKFPASFFMGVSMSRVVFQTPCASIPVPIAVMTTVNKDGLVCCDIERSGYWIPPAVRNYSAYRRPDLLDAIGEIVRSLAEPELVPQSRRLAPPSR